MFALMTEKRFLAAVALASVGLTLLLVGGVAAKSHCRKDCKQEITSCLALVPSNRSCTGTRAEKRICRKTHAAARKTCHHLVRLCKQTNPGTSGICVGPTTSTTIPGTSGCGMFLTTWGTPGSGNGQFDHPIGVATDASGNVYVGEGLFGGRIQKFDANGGFLTTWGSAGQGDGQFNGIHAVATD